MGGRKKLAAYNYTRWFKYDRDDLCVNKSQFVPVIFEPPYILKLSKEHMLHQIRICYSLAVVFINPRPMIPGVGGGGVLLYFA
jgi:hypothetical protein